MAAKTHLTFFPQFALAFTLAFIQLANSASPPKPPDLYNGYTTTSLPNGTWLITGGLAFHGNIHGPASSTASVCLYDPVNGIWTNTGSMNSKRAYHAATLLSNGKVLAVGGEHDGDLSSAELYDPSSGQWIKTGSLNIARRGHTATLLADGRVLVAGGVASRTNYPRIVRLESAELYNPVTEKWAVTVHMSVARSGHTATLLSNGLILVAGGNDQSGNWLFSAELYDPVAGKWTMTGAMPYESRYFYTATSLTNGQVLLTASGADYEWQLTNAWEVSKELYDPSSGTWKAIGPPRPHFVSSRDLDRTLTISPESGSSFLASQEIELLVESADRFGVTNISMFQDGVKVGESEESPMRYTVTNAAAGTYIFVAKATYANGLASTSSPVSISFKASDLEVFLAPGPTEFISDVHVNSSPAILLAVVAGVNPDALTKLTLNGVPQPLRTGNFTLSAPLSEGENPFVLIATDKEGRTAQAEATVYLDSKPPTISITTPANNVSLNVMRVGVRGTFAEKSLKGITVNRMPAFIKSNTFEALNVFLELGTNPITAVAEDTAGNLSTNSIVILGPTDTNVYSIDPVQLIADHIGGFMPLKVSFKVQAKVPGELKRVFYDFDGDHMIDKTATDLQPVTVTFADPGDRFPVVTLETTVGRFSSIGSWDWFFPVVRVCVQEPPLQVRELKVTDPVDLQCTKEGNLYVLSRKMAAVTEFDSTGKVVRTISKIGSAPQGLCVDDEGNVYVAMTADNQVWKFKPTVESFEPDMSFNATGRIGKVDKSVGDKPSQFNGPYDVVVMPDGKSIWVSDTGNNRIQKFRKDGTFIDSFGRKGTNLFEFDSPKGMFGNEIATICVVDSGNNRVVECYDFGPVASSGHAGTALGEFRGAVNVSLNERGICVADTGNNRIQLFDPGMHWHGSQLSPLNPRLAISKELGLKQPSAVAWVSDLLEDKVHVADTGNDRVVLVRLPGDNPEGVWNAMKQCLLKGDIDGATLFFASGEADKYRQSFLAIGTNDIIKIASEIPAIKPVVIKRDSAQYHFEKMIQGQEITFPIEFVKENGKWKIMEY